MIDIEQAFNPETKSVHIVFQNPGIGYYIPLYQREYSWDQNNIEQLLFDIKNGIENIIESDTDEIRFLGTIITVAEPNKKENIRPQDPAGLPGTVEKVIDGQQRLSTISLFATILHDQFQTEILNKISKNSNFNDEYREICDQWMQKLIDIFSFDLKRGTPKHKPKIIRGNLDAWTKDGNILDFYKSDVSLYLAKYISYIFEKGNKPKFTENDSKVYKNLKQINSWFKNEVLKDSLDSEAFPSGQTIHEHINPEHIWAYDRDHLKDILNSNDSPDKELLSKLIKLCAVSHYILERCCFTIIQPRTDDWAFDLFQSLNATGTPLTAIETFHPLVVNNIESQNKVYKESQEYHDFKQIDSLFSNTKTAAQKSKLTNDFLTSFAIASKGDKLASHFSAQRKWLMNTYESLETPDKKSEFINFMGSYSDFYKNYWLNIDPSIDISDSHKIKIAYLKDSGHKMAITILGYLYHQSSIKNTYEDFFKAIDVITSFYTLWRSSNSNAGLDNLYRQFFKGDDKKNLKASHWNSSNNFNINTLIQYFNECLKEKGISEYEDWLELSRRKLNYKDANKICRYALINYYNDTIDDSSRIGLLKKARKGTDNIMIWDNWSSGLYKSIEHIAPQNNDSFWDTSLYGTDNVVNTIGNLTLLPTKINSMLSNNSWSYKKEIYDIIGEKDPEITEKKIEEISKENYKLSIKLKDINKLNIIKSATFICNLDKRFIWNKRFVNSRTDNILNILWEEIKFDQFLSKE